MLGMGLRLISVLFFRSLHFVRFPNSTFRFFFNSFRSRSVLSEKFGRKLAAFCIAPRNDLISFVFSGGFNFNMASFSSFGFIPFSSISWPNRFCFMKNSDFFLLARHSAFSSLFRTSNSFVSWSCLFPRFTIIMSSSRAGVQYPSVRSIFS